MATPTVKTIWVFDRNRRIYPQGATFSSPIWREHYEKHSIVAETRMSWITATGVKLSKALREEFVFSEEELDHKEFLHLNLYKIADQVRQLKDYETVLRIAELAHYTA